MRNKRELSKQMKVLRDDNAAFVCFLYLQCLGFAREVAGRVRNSAPLSFDKKIICTCATTKHETR